MSDECCPLCGLGSVVYGPIRFDDGSSVVGYSCTVCDYYRVPVPVSQRYMHSPLVSECVSTTCVCCTAVSVCTFALDPYNVDGDCLWHK